MRKGLALRAPDQKRGGVGCPGEQKKGQPSQDDSTSSLDWSTIKRGATVENVFVYPEKVGRGGDLGGKRARLGAMARREKGAFPTAHGLRPPKKEKELKCEALDTKKDSPRKTSYKRACFYHAKKTHARKRQRARAQDTVDENGRGGSGRRRSAGGLPLVRHRKGSRQQKTTEPVAGDTGGSENFKPRKRLTVTGNRQAREKGRI